MTLYIIQYKGVTGRPPFTYTVDETKAIELTKKGFTYTKFDLPDADIIKALAGKATTTVLNG